MKGYPAKSSMSVELFRGGKLLPATLVPVEFPRELAERLGWDALGIRIGKPSRNGGLEISEIRPGSPAARIGLVSGDVVLRVNKRVLEADGDLRESLVDAREAGSVLLHVRRGRAVYHLTLPFQRS